MECSTAGDASVDYLEAPDSQAVPIEGITGASMASPD